MFISFPKLHLEVGVAPDLQWRWGLLHPHVPDARRGPPSAVGVSSVSDRPSRIPLLPYGDAPSQLMMLAMYVTYAPMSWIGLIIGFVMIGLLIGLVVLNRLTHVVKNHRKRIGSWWPVGNSRLVT